MSLGNVLSSYNTNYNRYAGYAGTKSQKEMNGDFYSGLSSAAERTTGKGSGEVITFPQDRIGLPERMAQDYFGNVATYEQGLDCRKYAASLEQWGSRPAADEQKLIGEFSDEEWDELLAKMDAQIEVMQASVEEEVEQKEDSGVRYTSVSSRNHWDDPDTKQTEYSGSNGLTVYTREGIFYLESACNTKDGAYTDRVEWSIKFDSEEAYERAMEWLSRFPEGDSKRFATSEEFWTDFLSGELDEDSFMAFYAESDHGVPRLLVSDEEGNTRIDEEVMKSPFFRYFGIRKTMTPISLEELMQRFHEQVSAELRGEKYQQPMRGKSLQDTARELFADAGERNWQFAGEDKSLGLQEWLEELLNRARGGLMEELRQKKEQG